MFYFKFFFFRLYMIEIGSLKNRLLFSWIKKIYTLGAKTSMNIAWSQIIFVGCIWKLLSVSNLYSCELNH